MEQLNGFRLERVHSEDEEVFQQYVYRFLFLQLVLCRCKQLVFSHRILTASWSGGARSNVSVFKTYIYRF